MDESSRDAPAGTEGPKRRARRQPKPPDLAPEGFPYFLDFEGEDRPPPFKLLCRNYYRYRSHAEVATDDIPVCHCTPPGASQDPRGAAQGDAQEGTEEGVQQVPRGCNPDTCLNALLSTECTPGHCPTGEACQNQRFQRCEYKRISVRKVEGRGWGMIAAENIEAGAFVMEYCGEVVPIEVAARRLEAYEGAGEKNVYTLELSSAECIDPTQMGAPARFINHSCDPNCETRKWTVLGEVRVGVFTRRFVPAGTELTYDYNFQWFGGEKVRCRCGAACCVGFLGAKSRGFQEEFEEIGGEAVPWQSYDDLFDVEQIPTYDSSSEDDEQQGGAREPWAAYQGLSGEASEGSEESGAEGQRELERHREMGSDARGSPSDVLQPDDDVPSYPSGLPRKRGRRAAGSVGLPDSQAVTGLRDEHWEAADGNVGEGPESASFLDGRDGWEELEEGPWEDAAVQEEEIGGAALASVADMMDKKRRSSRRQASVRDSSERSPARTRKAASTSRKSRKEKPTAAKAEEGTTWLDIALDESVQHQMGALPPSMHVARKSLLEGMAKLKQARERFLQLKGSVEEEMRLTYRGGVGVETGVEPPGASGEALQAQLREAWLDGLGYAWTLRQDLVLAQSCAFLSLGDSLFS